MEDRWVPRWAESRVRDALEDTPVVVLHGPRQSGKTWLAKRMGGSYVTLDDGIALDEAVRSPEGFLAAFSGRAVIDEAQRAPQLFRAVKAEVDRDRTAGRFLLTGSAQVLALPRLSDSLAGRAEVVTLWPMAQGEIERRPPCLLKRLFAGEAPPDRPSMDWAGRVTTGGFPEPWSRRNPARRGAWFDAYVRTLAERDVRDLAQVEGLTAIPRLLRCLARGAGEVLNISSLSRETGVPHTTLTRYLSLLEAVFLVRPAAAWTVGRALKSPRLWFADTGVLCRLNGLVSSSLAEDPVAHLPTLQNFAAMECLRMAEVSEEPLRLMHFRSIRRYEVPIVVEHADGRLVAATVCPSPRPSVHDARPLQYLAEVAEDRFAAGVILHLGSEVRRLGDRLWSAPLGALWG